MKATKLMQAATLVLALFATACAGASEDTDASQSEVVSQTSTTALDGQSNDPPGTVEGEVDEGPDDVEESVEVEQGEVVDDGDLETRSSAQAIEVPGFGEVVPLPCAALAEPLDIDRVDPSANEFPADTLPIEPGRYGSESLGLSFAVDIPGYFTSSDSLGGNAESVFSDQFEAVIIHRVRTDRFVLETLTEEEFFERDPLSGTIDEFLERDGIELVADGEIEVSGLPAREIVIDVDAEAIGPFGDANFTENTTLQEGPGVRLVLVELEPEDDLLLIQMEGRGNPEFDEAASELLESLTIGEIGPSRQVLYESTPWDAGNFFSSPETRLVDACTVSALAFGGVSFDLAEPSLVEGAGSEIWIKAAAANHVGFVEPEINIVAPEFRIDGGELGPPEFGDRLTTVDEVVSLLEEKGYELAPREDDVRLFDLDTLAFDFAVTGDPFVWAARSNGVSDGLFFLSENGTSEGQMYIVETPFGIIVASLLGEIDSGDAELLRERWDLLVETLQFVEPVS